jgi:hypothetical protein
MKAAFTKCWTCPPALAGKRVAVLHRCPTTLCLRVLLSHELAEAHCATRLPIWRASSDCWNSGAGGVHEVLCGLSACRARQRFPASCVRREGRRGRVGECFSRWSAPSPTLPAVSSYLRLRPSQLRPLVRTATSTASRNHGVYARGICSSSTRTRSQAHAADCESSPGHSALLLSLLHGTRNSRRPSPFPAPLYPTIPARLRSASHRCRPGNPPQTRAASHHATLIRRSC